MEKQKNIIQEYPYQNPWMKVREDTYTQDGQERLYGVVERSNSVVIIPLSPTGNTLLLNQFRYPTQKYSLELPMGGINEKETNEAAAKRELKEETGISANEIHSIGNFCPVPGLSNQTVEVFIASVSDEALHDVVVAKEEDIDGCTIVSLTDLYLKVTQGEITDGFTLTSLFFLSLHKKRYTD